MNVSIFFRVTESLSVQILCFVKLKDEKILFDYVTKMRKNGTL